MNSNAQTHARGWANLFNGFRGENSDSPPHDPIDYLPFPDQFREDLASSDRVDKRRVSRRSAEIALRLIESAMLPPHVTGSLAVLMDEMEAIVKP